MQLNKHDGKSIIFKGCPFLPLYYRKKVGTRNSNFFKEIVRERVREGGNESEGETVLHQLSF